MAIVISGNGIDMGNNPVSNVDVGSFDNNAATVDYVKNNGDVSAVTSYSQVSGINEISGIELTNSIHDVFGDGSAVATYTLNGNANDLGGNYNGTATNVTYSTGKFGQGAVFNSIATDYIVSNSLLPTLTSFSVSFWANHNSAQTDVGYARTMFAFENKFAITRNNGILGVYYNNVGTVQSSLGAVVNDVFQHIVITYSGGQLKAFIDGNNTSTVSITVNSFQAKALISQMSIAGGTVNEKFQGTIDQVRIFNRALTQSEINTLYTESRVSANVQLNISQGTFIYTKGLGARGYIKSSDVFTGTVNVSAQTDGWKYVAKDENNNFSFYTDKPTIGKKSATLYLENGKLWSQGAGIIPDGSTNTSTTKVTPDMTSNSQGGFIVSASSEYSTNFQAYKAFDGLDSSQWWETSGSVNTSGYLQVQLPVAKVINKYSILPPKDTVTNSPKSWTIQASNTGAFAGEQVTLDTRSNITGYVAGVPKYFTFINGNQYLYYRIVISENNGAPKLGISEFQLIEAQVSTGDGFPITPISFLSNKVRIASGVAVELAPSDISKTVTESLEADSYSGKNAIVAYATIDMTATPPTILDSYNVASVVRSSNGVGKITLVNSVDKNNITAICGTNAVAGTITSTTKSEINFATGTTNYAKTTIIVTGGKF